MPPLANDIGPPLGFGHSTLIQQNRPSAYPFPHQYSRLSLPGAARQPAVLPQEGNVSQVYPSAHNSYKMGTHDHKQYGGGYQNHSTGEGLQSRYAHTHNGNDNRTERRQQREHNLGSVSPEMRNVREAATSPERTNERDESTRKSTRKYREESSDEEETRRSRRSVRQSTRDARHASTHHCDYESKSGYEHRSTHYSDRDSGTRYREPTHHHVEPTRKSHRKKIFATSPEGSSPSAHFSFEPSHELEGAMRHKQNESRNSHQQHRGREKDPHSSRSKQSRAREGDLIIIPCVHVNECVLLPGRSSRPSFSQREHKVIPPPMATGDTSDGETTKTLFHPLVDSRERDVVVLNKYRGYISSTRGLPRFALWFYTGYYQNN